jgi:ADP-ribose pyrophosphatase YjhB (NUDIX family)
VKLVADVALVAEGHVLLVRYEDVSGYDGQRGWFLPDDYLVRLEHPDDAARRIARDQAGIELAEPGLAEIESFGDGNWHLIFHYLAELDAKPEVRAGDNVKDAKWFALDALPDANELAHHGWAREVLDRII